MKVEVSSIPLTLRHTFRIAREASDKRKNVLLKLTDEDGVYGLGEAAPSVYYNQTAESVQERLRGMSESDFEDPYLREKILERAEGILGEQRSALAAVDMALHDWLGKRLGVPLYRLFGLNPAETPLTSFTIGLAEGEELLRKLEEAKEYPVLKLKLGTERDREIVSVVRSATTVPIWVDANAAWGFEEAREKIKWLADEGVELVEQPLPAEDLEGLKRLTDLSSLPIIADESARTAKDVLRLRGCVHGINIKLSKCGGLSEALKMIHLARTQGMKIMLGCFIETSLSITAAAHLSPLVDYADLDGHLLIANDPFAGVEEKEGRLILPDRPGIGVVERDWT